jgi:hypothetical protein
MTSRREISPAEAAQTTQRIDQFFNFMRDAIDDPQILESMPSDSTLMFRDIVHKGQLIRLTAFLPKQLGALWGARVSGIVPLGAPLAVGGRGSEGPSVAGHDTADAALDALESEIGAVTPSQPDAQHAAGD